MSNKQLHNNFKGWLVVSIGGLFYLYQFMLRVSPNIMHDELLDLFAIDAGTLGSVIGAYYWSYTLMQLPLGITMDRIGPRYFLVAAAIVCACSCYLFGHTDSLYLAYAARFLMGMGSACGLVGTIKLGTTWVAPQHIAKVTSMAILMGTMGASLGGAPLRYVLVHVGLQTTMELLALLGLAVGFIIYLSVKIHPPIQHHRTIHSLEKINHPLSDLRTVIRQKQAWIAAFYGMLMYAPITIIGIAWGAPFIKSYYDIDEALAVSVVSTMFVGAAIGSPAVAFISDLLLKKRRLPMVIGAVISVLVWSIVIFVDDIPLVIMYGLFFLGGLAYTFKTLSFAVVCDIMPRSLSGISIAFVNMVVMATGIIFHPLVGELMDYSKDMRLNVDVLSYSLTDFRFALAVIPISAVVALFILLFMHESHPLRNGDEFEGILDRDTL